MTRWGTVKHEAGHCAMGALLGLPVHAVYVNPIRGGGVTQFMDLDFDRDGARRLALMVMAGPAMADQPIPQWPLEWHRTSDEKVLELATSRLGMDEADYGMLEAEMWKLTTTERFERLFFVLTEFLRYTDRLDDATLAKAKVIAWLDDRGEAGAA